MGHSLFSPLAERSLGLPVLLGSFALAEHPVARRAAALLVLLRLRGSTGVAWRRRALRVRRHSSGREVTWRRWVRVRVGHRMAREMRRGWVNERVRGWEGMWLDRSWRWWWMHRRPRVWRTWRRRRPCVCLCRRWRLALPGCAGGGLGHGGRVVAETEGLESARRLGLRRVVVEGIWVSSRWLLLLLLLVLLLLLRRLLRLVRGGWVSQHGQ
ncbi:hypothetical protein FKP32DRAFT_1075493 [Trametes sanguinea]|nr:hypothetical protein FKP32DRAFT_1075493 [Trametes sanguinea]